MKQKHWILGAAVVAVIVFVVFIRKNAAGKTLFNSVMVPPTAGANDGNQNY